VRSLGQERAGRGRDGLRCGGRYGAGDP
jgi:hypothetical protein